MNDPVFSEPITYVFMAIAAYCFGVALLDAIQAFWKARKKKK